jgi:hypothetical protein
MVREWENIIPDDPSYRASRCAWLLDWAIGDISAGEAQTWIDAGLVDPYHADEWRREGFDPVTASRWRRQIPGIKPWIARADHLAAFGETRGLGPPFE